MDTMLSVVVEIGPCETEIPEWKKAELEKLGELVASLVLGELNKVWIHEGRVEIERDWDY